MARPASPQRRITVRIAMLFAWLLLCATVMLGAEEQRPIVIASETASADVGAPVSTATPQQFLGGLTTTYEIRVPRTVLGIAPELALVYNSRGGNGWPGTGWELALPTIERQVRPGHDYIDDRFVFRTSAGVENLVRLASGMYAPEIASRFDRFESLVAVDGRRSWRVTSTRGIVSLYGISDDSRLSNPADPDKIFAWRLVSVTDTNGNAIHFSYVKDGAQIYLDTIRYAEGRGIAARMKVTFVSEPRPDVEYSHQLGFPLTTARRLRQIAVEANGNALPSYELQYSESVTHRSLLRAIVLRAPNGQEMPATRFDYQGAPVSAPQMATWSDGPKPGAAGQNCLTMDLNGDSLTDVACNALHGQWDVALSTGSGFATRRLAGPNVGALVGGQCAALDMTADGRSEIICYSGSAGLWHRVFGSDNGWDRSDFIAGPAPGLPIGKQCLQGDWNDDRRGDLACSTTVGDQWHVVYGGDAGFTGGFETGPAVADAGARCAAIDFNGQHGTDIVCWRDRSEWDLWRSGPEGWTLRKIRGPVAGVPISDRCQFGYFDNDLRVDSLCATGVDNLWHLGISTPGGFDGESIPVARVGIPVTRQCYAADRSLDGKTDLTCFTGSGTLYHVIVARGRSFATEAVPSGPYPGKSVGGTCLVGDFTGRGGGELACHAGGGMWQIAVNSETAPDLLTSIQTPLGGKVSFGYSRASSMAGNRMPVPMVVLSSTTYDDGLGKSSTTSFAYSGGHYDVVHGEFRGFRRVSVTEPGGTITRTLFHQGNLTGVEENDPDAEHAYMRGRPARVRVFDASGALQLEKSFVYANATGRPRFNPLTEVLARQCDGDTICQETRTVLSYDEHGNVVKETNYGDTSITSDDYTRTVTYAKNLGKHIVSLPASEEIRAGGNGATRLSLVEMFYDGGSCSEASSNPVPQRGNVTRVRRWVANGLPPVETLTAYDDIGNQVCVRDPLGRRTTFEFNALRQFVLASVNALGHRTTFTYYGVGGQPLDRGSYGQLRSVTDPNGAVARKEYDVFGREVRDVTATGASTSYAYVSIGRPGEQHIRADNSAGLMQRTDLDGFGREVRTRRTGPAGRTIVTTTRYNARGLVVATSLPYFELGTPMGEIVTTYDAQRRPLRRTDPAGAQRCYCRNDGVTDVIDENGHRTRQIHSAAGQLLRVEEYKGTYKQTCPVASIDGSALPAPYAVTRYVTDPLGRLVSITDARGTVIGVEYDGLGRRTRVIDSYSGERRYAYDANGNVVLITTASGQTIHSLYDPLDRLVQKSYGSARPLGLGDVLWVYDEARSNGIGHLTSTRTPNASKAIHYDAAGQAVRIDRTIHGRTYSISQTYDDIGRVTGLTYPDGALLTYAYDGPVLRSVAAGTTVYARLSDYNAAGAPGKIVYGNGVTTNLTYETPSNPLCPRATYRLCSSTTLDALGTRLHETIYESDHAGNITGTREPKEMRYFFHDEFDRLTATARRVPGGALVYEEKIEYNETNDIVWKTGVGAYVYGVSGAGRFPRAVHRAGDQPLTYDADGNVVASFGRTYSIDVEGKLAAVSDGTGTTQYFYDADDSLVGEGSAAGAKIHVGGLYECVSGRCVKNVFAGALKIAVVGESGTAYVHLDHQGSTRLVTDARGTVVASYRYSAFGLPAVTGRLPSFVPTPYLYGGHPFAASHGLHLLGGRPYDPRLGRFLSPDSLFVGSGPTRYLNRYAYALNNPMTFSDPDGHFAWAIIGAIIGAVIGGTTAYLRGDDVLQGALFGAITGAFTGGAYELAAGLDGVARALIYATAGAGGAATNAAIQGGDIGMAVGVGAVFGLASGTVGGEAFQFFQGAETSAVVGIANQLANTAARGAAFGALHAAVTGGSVWDGLRQGAVNYALGEAFNMGVGHAVGFVGTGGKAPEWMWKQFVYPREGWVGITFSNVTSAQWSSLASNFWYGFWHEVGHTWQSMFLGPAYIPAHAVALSFGGLFGGTHTFNLLENTVHPHPMGNDYHR